MNNNGGSFSPDDISQWFWDVVHEARQDRDRFVALLQGMSREEIIRFDDEFQEAAAQLVDDPYFESMDQDETEDGAKDIADFVVSQGKSYYSDIWTHPEKIPPSIPPGEPKTLSGVAAKHFWRRFHESIPSPDEM